MNSNLSESASRTMSMTVSKHPKSSPAHRWLLLPLLSAPLMACNPTVRVEAPDKPIEINMNINIQHDIRVRVEKELDEILSEDSGLF